MSTRFPRLTYVLACLPCGALRNGGLIALLLLFLLPARVHALPQLPHTLYGALSLDGQLAADGTVVGIVINGQQVIQTTVFSDGGNHGLYSVNVPADDPDTAKDEGGVNGDTVSFDVAGYEIAQSIIFKSGLVTELNLANSPVTYNFTRDINGAADVTFLANDGGPSLIVNANGADLGHTDVAVRGNSDCTSLPGEAVYRCFDVAPANRSERAATLTFFFYSSQLPEGQSCATLNAYRSDESGWQLLALDGSYGTGGRVCSGDRYSLRVIDVNDFSPFVLKNGTPNAIRIQAMQARSALQGAEIVALWAIVLVVLGAAPMLGRTRRS